jgi:hypothetical protein
LPEPLPTDERESIVELRKRAERAERALEEALEERNQLWAELHEQKARADAAGSQAGGTTIVWRASSPLRRARRIVAELRMMVGLARRYLAWRRTGR